MGIDALPPPASGLPTRLVLGPALRAQSDRRLVRLVREGYESAFEEIVRRYRRPLDRFAAGIVGGRSEDVTQDSFRKALEALRHGDSEVELRPWLYRIVRNTALNDLRDRPPAAAELADELIGGGRSAAAEAEERAEVAALVTRLRALPENQRAALVMRELEGMSHEEIATALAISHGAARQAIARARTTVRSGFGALVPLPLLRALASAGDGAVEAAGGAGTVGAAAGSGAAIGGGSVMGSGAAAVSGGIGAGAVLKVGLATVAVAGSIGAGVAIDHHGSGHHAPDPRRAVASAPGGPSGEAGRSTTFAPLIADVDNSSGSGRRGDDTRGPGGGGHRGDDDKHHGRGDGDGSSSGHRGNADDRRDHRGPGGGGDDSLSSPVVDQPASTVSGDDHGGRSRGGSGSGSHGSDGSGPSGHGRSNSSGSGGSGSGGNRSGHVGSGGSGSGHGGGGNGSGGSGSGHGSASSGGDASSNSGSGSGSSSSSRGGPGSGDATETVVGTGAAATPSLDGSESSSSGSGSSGSGFPGPSGGPGSSESSGGPGSSGSSSSSSSNDGSSSDSGSSGGS